MRINPPHFLIYLLRLQEPLLNCLRLRGFRTLCDTSSRATIVRSFHPNYQMELSPASAHQTLPPLLALPTELKSEIISHIPHGGHPTLACLHRTDSLFLDLIPKAHSRSNPNEMDLFNQLHKPERSTHTSYPPATTLARSAQNSCFSIDLITH